MLKNELKKKLAMCEKILFYLKHMKTNGGAWQ